MSVQDITRRLRYAAWAARKGIVATDRRCPACGQEAAFLRRKLLVVSLRECKSCGLRFRTPKDDDNPGDYYESSYCDDYAGQRPPSPGELKEMIRTGFANDPDKNFTKYIGVLKTVGLKPGDALLDFGSSWGFGSWQFRQAGFKVYSYELSKARAAYARNLLGCTVLDDISEVPERLSCLFSSHVIEHLPDPSLIWQVAAKVLRHDGFIAVFCPNGEPGREAVIGSKQYGYLWPQVHPMVITPGFARATSGKFGYSGLCYSTPYDLNLMANGIECRDLNGSELCIIARHVPPTNTTADGRRPASGRALTGP